MFLNGLDENEIMTKHQIVEIYKENSFDDCYTILTEFNEEMENEKINHYMVNEDSPSHSPMKNSQEESKL